MENRNTITSLTLETLTKSKTGNTEYAQIIKAEIIQLKKIGLMNLTADYVRKLEKRLTTAEIKFLLENDNEEAYYTDVCKNLGVTIGMDFDPYEILPSICYPVSNLIGPNFKHMAVRELEGGRVFESSGTTNPAGRKKIYYDAVSCLFIRELHTLAWEQIIGAPLSKKIKNLFLAPPEAVYGMPFAALVVDFLSASGSRVYFSAAFIAKPLIYKDKDFQVLTAKLDFKKNLVLNKSMISKFNLATKLSSGPHTVLGLLPAILAMEENTKNFKGIKAFFAKAKPALFAHGGGLKNQGIPLEIQEKGIEAVAGFLKIISNLTGFEPEYLLSLYSSPAESDKQKLDDILTLYANYILKSRGARILNVYAAADMQPVMFSVGTLAELYGGDFYRAGLDNQANKDIYFYLPGQIVELIDQTTGAIIPKKQLNKPGILVIWNPYTVSHLQVPLTEDLLQWVKIPETAPLNPPYLEGIGLQFVSRIKGAKGTGIC